MHGATTRSRVPVLARLLLVLVAVLGVVGMHALVVGTPTSSHADHATHAHAVAATSVEDAGRGVVAAASTSGSSQGPGHDPADHSGLAHLCLALAAAIFLLLVRRILLAATPAGPAAPVAVVRAAVRRWARPPPDPVAVLCVSRT